MTKSAIRELLSKLHSIVKMALFSIFFAKFLDHMSTYALKIYQKICTKIAHFSNQSEFWKKSIKKKLTIIFLNFNLGIGSKGMNKPKFCCHVKRETPFLIGRKFWGRKLASTLILYYKEKIMKKLALVTTLLMTDFALTACNEHHNQPGNPHNPNNPNQTQRTPQHPNQPPADQR